MSVFALLVLLVVLGVTSTLVQRSALIHPTFKLLIYGVILIATLWVLLGLLATIGLIPWHHTLIR